MAKLFYIREAHSISKPRQLNAAKARGIPSRDIWIEGRNEWETLDALLDDGLRPGDTLEVVRAVVLAPPMSGKGSKRPSELLQQIMTRLHDIGVTVYETEPERSSKEPSQLSAMIFEALRHLSKPITGKRRVGAPSWVKPVPALYEAAKAVWLDTVRYRSNADAMAEITALPEQYGGPWSRAQCYRQFGSSGRKSAGRPNKST